MDTAATPSIRHCTGIWSLPTLGPSRQESLAQDPQIIEIVH